MSSTFTRRDFLRSGLIAGSAGIIVPTVLAKGVMAATNDQVHNDRVLVILQMGGGNDGLNTLVPLTDPAYRSLRPTVAIPASQALTLQGTSSVGLHPALTRTRSAFNSGNVAVVQGVGYPNPNYSHFQSMAVWQTADPALRAGDDGWLATFLNAQITGANQPLCTCALGEDSIPGEMRARQQPPVSVIGSGGDFRYWGGASQENTALSMYTNTPGPFGLMLDSTLRTLNGSVDALATASYAPSVSYTAPGATAPTDLATSFQLAAKIIVTEPATKIIHLSCGSFDTHQNQLTDQAALLADLDFAVSAFLADLTAHAQDSRVAVMTWSEFGRRAGENASGGTDHGSAGTVLLFGTPVRGGLAGAPCSLTDLDNDNLKHTTDFRSVYQSVIGDWLGGDATSVLGGTWPALSLFR
jgi:uncharacterized protein (DUF1501 family)